MAPTWSAALRGMPFFATLDEATMTRLADLCRKHDYTAGEIMIGHGDQSFDVLFLLSGRARVNLYSIDGTRVSFRDIAAGAIFGELSAIDGEPRSASVECVESCTAAIMPRKAFTEALAAHPAFAKAVMTHLTRQVRSLTARVFEFSTLAVRNRVQAELLRFAAAVDPQGKEALLSPSPHHAEIASRVSTHREAVTRELSRLESMGLIAKDGRNLLIKDIAKLRRLVDEGSE